MDTKSKSKRYQVQLSKTYSGEDISLIIVAVASQLGVYISHIGSFSRVKYPNSIHWHFKEQPKEKGCIDATFWEEGNQFWIDVRNYEPRWVKVKAIEMQSLLQKVL